MIEDLERGNLSLHEVEEQLKEIERVAKTTGGSTQEAGPSSDNENGGRAEHYCVLIEWSKSVLLCLTLFQSFWHNFWWQCFSFWLPVCMEWCVVNLCHARLAAKHRGQCAYLQNEQQGRDSGQCLPRWVGGKSTTIATKLCCLNQLNVHLVITKKPYIWHAGPIWLTIDPMIYM